MDNNGNGTISIHLNKLTGVSVVENGGKKSVMIPVDENGIYISERGTIVLSYFMSKMQEEKWGKTHCLKRKMSKDEYLKSTREQRDNMPVGGYFEPMRPREGGCNNNATPSSPAPQHPQTTNYGGGVGDLPF